MYLNKKLADQGKSGKPKMSYRSLDATNNYMIFEDGSVENQFGIIFDMSSRRLTIWLVEQSSVELIALSVRVTDWGLIGVAYSTGRRVVRNDIKN